MISGGVSHSMTPKTQPTIIITVDPAVRYPERYYTDGIGITTVRFDRYMPHAKSNNYIEGVRQTQLAEQMGAVEPLYYSDEQVFEGSNSNVFAVIDNILVTPKSNILEGVTRRVLLEILYLDIPIEVRDFSLENFMVASEAFLSASGKEILPITSVDGKSFGVGKVGPITQEVMRQYHAYTASNAW
jgi:branched-subunit amino acid aminotransferase/4-amino-4-deoxychorismate lyase